MEEEEEGLTLFLFLWGKITRRWRWRGDWGIHIY